MRHFLAAWGMAFACALGSPAFAQTDANPVPVLMAPYHVPVFKNDYVTLFDVYVPPGHTTGYHTHADPTMTVNIQSSEMVIQDLGGQPRSIKSQAPGHVTYYDFGKKPATHQASNMGAVPNHDILFQLNTTEPGHFTPSTRADVPAYVQIMDNERIRGWRLLLEPGQTVSAITQGAPGLRVVVAGGDLVEIVPGRPERAEVLRSGEFFWQNAGTTRGLRNTAATRIELVEFELK